MTLSLIEQDLFNKFWEAYPVKKNMGTAESEWQFLRIDPQLCIQIVKAVKIAKLSNEWTKDQGKWIPAPHNFLKGKRWLEYKDFELTAPSPTPAIHKLVDNAKDYDIKRNHELARDSREFIEMVYKFKPHSKEKYQYEMEWCEIMGKKYPHLITEYRLHYKQARDRLASVLVSSSQSTPEAAENHNEAHVNDL